MNRILKVAQREYAETVKTKTFLIGVLMAPVLVGGIALLGRAVVGAPGSRPPARVALLDLTGKLADDVKAAFEPHTAGRPQRKVTVGQIRPGGPDADEFARQAKERVRQGALDALIVVDKDVIDGAGSIRIYLGGGKAGDFDLPSILGNAVNNAVLNQRYKLRGLSPELLAELHRRVPVEEVDVSAGPAGERSQGEGDRVARAMVPFFFMFMMFMGIFGSGQQMLTSIVEEKNSRVIEVLLSAISPFQLMAGKILGLAAVSLTVIALWAASAYGAARWQGIAIGVPLGMAPYFVVYFVLGFILLSAILAGIGSVCNTVKEAQALIMPISIVLVVPMVTWLNMVQDPRGVLARVLSFVPPATPMVMVLRLSADPKLPAMEVAASILVLAASVPAAMWAAAKVFRTGILMYGKRPGLREIIRWIGRSS